MFAPRLVPPCLIVSVAESNTFMNEMGPEETPLVDCTMSFFGRIREKENPVPPPDLCIRAVSFMAVKMLSIESSMGRTKQAESWPSSRSAFIRVGELGRKSRETIRDRNSVSVALISALGSYRLSARAIALATRMNMSIGFSITLPFSSFLRYRRFSTLMALGDRESSGNGW